MGDKRLTHLDERGQALMVDVSAKEETLREAVARGRVRIGAEAFQLLMDEALPKGDAMAVARVAGILGAKKVDELIPLCHPLPLAAVELQFYPDATSFAVDIEARVRTKAATGVEMEALTAVSVAALALYDMCKAVEKGIVIEQIQLEYKSGGSSGTWKRTVSGG